MLSASMLPSGHSRGTTGHRPRATSTDGPVLPTDTVVVITRGRSSTPSRARYTPETHYAVGQSIPFTI